MKHSIHDLHIYEGERGGEDWETDYSKRERKTKKNHVNNIILLIELT